MDLLFEDTGYFDLTTYGLEIGDYVKSRHVRRRRTSQTWII